jgi:hypothetical protein
MTVSYVAPFRVFKSFVEFYPKLGTAIAFSTMAAAARMIPTAAGVRAASADSAATSDALQIATGSELVASGNNSSPQKLQASASDRPPEGRLIQPILAASYNEIEYRFLRQGDYSLSRASAQRADRSSNITRSRHSMRRVARSSPPALSIWRASQRKPLRSKVETSATCRASLDQLLC